MHNVPDGWFHENHLLWGSGKDFILSRGFDCQFPDLSTSDSDQWWRQEHAIRSILGALGPEEKAQVILGTGSDFDKPLSRYEDTPCGGIVKEVRTEIASRFRQRVKEETLINAHVRIYISAKLKFQRSGAFDHVFKVAQRNFEQRGSHLDEMIRSNGGSVTPLGDQEHYEDVLRHMSPGQFKNPPKVTDWNQSIESLCRYSEISPRKETDHGFFLDGHYVGVWVIKKMPKKTWPKTMEPFFELTLPGLSVTLNLEPIKQSEEMKRQRVQKKKILKNLHDEEAAAALEETEGTIRSLRRSEMLPFKAQLIIKLCAKSPAELDDKLEAVRGAIDHTEATGWRPAMDTTTVAFYNCTTPGFGPFAGYPDYYHHIYDQNLAHMWPVGSTPQAQLQEADWLSCGNQNNLIGGKLFIGSQPADMLCMGTKGAGKSATMQSILLQAAYQFKFIAIVDEGFSWISTTRLLDPASVPIVVRSNSRHTFNLFDTRGLALSPQHLRSAVALAQLLVGQSSDEDRQNDRGAILSKTIREVYDRAYRFWAKDNPELHYKAACLAAAALRSKEDFVDAVQALKGTEPEVPEEEALKAERDKATEHFVRDAAFSTWTPQMFPTLNTLWRELNSMRGQPIYQSLANHLEVWLRDGDYGAVVDGVSNMDLGTRFITEESPLKVVHFELGEMSEAESALKSVVGFLITNELRAVVQSMPRRFRKAVVIEEMTSFLRVPNASQIVIDYSERMRKYSCWLAYIFQQYSSLLKADPAVAEAIIGNAQTLMLLRNINREDLKVLDSHLKIPAPIIDTLQSFPMPELLKGRNDQYAGFVYVQRAEGTPTFTVGRNVISERLEKIISSSGDQFDEKRKQI